MKILIAYFSAEKKRTASVALSLKEFLANKATDKAADVDVFEITPETPYTSADLRWVNPLARCNREKFTGKMYQFQALCQIGNNTMLCFLASLFGTAVRRMLLIHSAKPMTGQARKSMLLLLLAAAASEIQQKS